MAEETKQTSPQPDPLLELAEKIKTELAAIVAQMNGKGLVLKAIRVGEQLKQAKEKVEHGEWLDWLKDNCNLKERTAQRYMRLVEHRAKIDEHLKTKSVTMTDLTLSKAFQLTAEPKEETEEEESDGDIPSSVVTSDNVDDLVDELIDRLKVMKADNPENAGHAASELVKKLELLDLLERKPKQRRAA